MSQEKMETTTGREAPGGPGGAGREAPGGLGGAGREAPGGSANAGREAPGAWHVVWACFVALGVIFGVNYSFAAFFEPLRQQFQATRADVSLIFGVSGLLYFVLGAGAGLLADRFGPRRVTSAKYSSPETPKIRDTSARVAWNCWRSGSKNAANE
jgi:hypothetical protein